MIHYPSWQSGLGRGFRFCIRLIVLSSIFSYSNKIFGFFPALQFNRIYCFCLMGMFRLMFYLVSLSVSWGNERQTSAADKRIKKGGERGKKINIVFPNRNIESVFMSVPGVINLTVAAQSDGESTSLDTTDFFSLFYSILPLTFLTLLKA